MPPKCYKCYCCCYCDYICLFWFITHLTCPTAEIGGDLAMCSPSLGPHARVFLSSYLPRQAELFMVTDIIWASVLWKRSQNSSISNMIPGGTQESVPYRPWMGSWWTLRLEEPVGWGQVSSYAESLHSLTSVGKGSSWCWCQCSINNRALYKQKGINLFPSW